MNKVILMGRLTHEVEMRQTPNGISVTRFSIAVNRRFAGKDAKQQADFINCISWRKTAEFIAKYFQKGSMIAIVGNIQSRTWENKEGKKQYATEVIVDEVYFTGSKQKTNDPQKAEPSGEPNSDDSDFCMEGFCDINGSEEELPF